MDPTTITPPSGLDWPQVVLLIAGMIVPPLVGVLVTYLRRVTRQRDAIIEGVERAGDLTTKRQVKVAASNAGVEEHLSASVERVTTRLRSGANGTGGPPLAMLLCLALCVLPGCASGLQESYVTRMEETHHAIMLDVREGLYETDAKADETLRRWAEANADARAVLEEEAR